MILEFNQIKPATHLIELTEDKKREILNTLFLVLANNLSGNALACNQIGINDYRIAVTNINQPVYLINPVILNKSTEMFTITESCLSLPNKIATTKRYKWIEVSAENFKEPIIFGDYDNNEKYRIIQLNMTATIQKMIDMLDGKSILDNQNEFKQVPVKIDDKKLGRNEFVTISRDGKEMKIKYKKIEPFLQAGWVINNN